MEKIEPYQGETPQSEKDRLNKMGYPNFVSEALLNDLVLENKKILDSGAGPNPGLAEFVSRKKGVYISLDLRIEMLKEMKGKLNVTDIPFTGVRADVRALPFDDQSIDIVHQRFVLMNIDPATRRRAVEEALRVGKEKIIFMEYNWRTLKSSENPEFIERFKNLVFQFFQFTHTDPYMGEKMKSLLEEVDPKLDFSLQSFVREESVDFTPEMILQLNSFEEAARKMIKNDILAEEFGKLITELNKMPLKFAPPEIIVATISL